MLWVHGDGAGAGLLDCAASERILPFVVQDGQEQGGCGCATGATCAGKEGAGIADRITISRLCGGTIIEVGQSGCFCEIDRITGSTAARVSWRR